MKLVKNSFALMGTMMLAVVLTLSACASTPTSKSTGEIVDDSVLTAKVNAEIAKDSVLSAFAVDVESYRGTVQISGFVDTEERIQEIEAIVAGVSGVKDVKNSLQVKPAS